MYCCNCDASLSDGEARWGFDEPYCEECFSSLYTYCRSCDRLITVAEAYTDDEDYTYCENCWDDEQQDHNAPNNPDVTEEDRKFIIRLSRNWLVGKIDYRKYININENDYFLRTIRQKVGLIDNPIYLFGLNDRDEYQVACSSNLIEDVKEFLLLTLPDITVIETFGLNRLGISYLLRNSCQEEIVDLIKHITIIKETIPA